jgi:hypothetical protein
MQNRDTWQNTGISGNVFVLRHINIVVLNVKKQGKIKQENISHKYLGNFKNFNCF